MADVMNNSSALMDAAVPAPAPVPVAANNDAAPLLIIDDKPNVKEMQKQEPVQTQDLLEPQKPMQTQDVIKDQLQDNKKETKDVEQNQQQQQQQKQQESTPQHILDIKPQHESTQQQIMDTKQQQQQNPQQQLELKGMYICIVFLTTIEINLLNIDYKFML